MQIYLYIYTSHYHHCIYGCSPPRDLMFLLNKPPHPSSCAVLNEGQLRGAALFSAAKRCLDGKRLWLMKSFFCCCCHSSLGILQKWIERTLHPWQRGVKVILACPEERLKSYCLEASLRWVYIMCISGLLERINKLNKATWRSIPLWWCVLSQVRRMRHWEARRAGLHLDQMNQQYDKDRLTVL